MNFLAHLYLSENHKEIMIGNFIADHVKGKQFQQFSENIKKGILFHRKIDAFTDQHAIVKTSKRRLHKRYGHYDGIIIDIFYDYFLAKNWNTYSAIPLALYTNTVYEFFINKSSELPLKSQEFIQYMVRYNILYNYQFKEGIQRVLNGMNKRTHGKSQMHLASNDLEKLEEKFEEDFKLFFKDLQNYCKEELDKIKLIQQ